MIDDLEALLAHQEHIYNSVKNAFANYKKDGQNRKTEAYFKIRLERIAGFADEFRANERKLMSSKVPKESDYPKMADEFEELYVECVSKMEADRDVAFPRGDKSGSCSQSGSSLLHPTHNPQPRLQKINVPVFEGAFTEWPNFHDLYCSLVHTNEDLSSVEKFWYLKGSLRGEPHFMVKHMATTDVNYNAAWKLLCNYYENPRELFKSHMNLFASQSKINDENAQAIRAMLSVTKECRHALSNFNLDLKHCDPILMYFLVQKLPAETVGLWETKIGGLKDLPNFDEFQQFLDTRIKTLEAISENKVISHRHTKFTKSLAKPNNSGDRSHGNHKSFHVVSNSNENHTKTNTLTDCCVCKERHTLRKCPKFLSMSTTARRAAIEGKQICTNCLAYNHTVDNCRSKHNCRCGARHHTLIHTDIYPTPTTLQIASTPHSSKLNSNDRVHTFTARFSQREVLLSTAIVWVKSLNGQYTELRALIDQGSQASLISARAAKLLNLPKTTVKTIVTGIGDTPADSCNQIVSLNIRSRISQYEIDITAFVMQKLTSVLPNKPLICSNWNHVIRLELADPKFFELSKVDLILGSDVFSQIIIEGIKKAPGLPTAQNTRFGWILFGELEMHFQPNIHVKTMTTKIEVENLLQRFWEIDTVPSRRELKFEEKWCETFFNETHSRDEHGRFSVRLPFKRYLIENAVLGKSRDIAIRHFNQLERRFLRDQSLYAEYSKCLNEYISAGQMKLVSTSEEDLTVNHNGTASVNCCYLAQHPVVKLSSSTTKLRIVFDASRKTTNGKSLNDILFPGPALHNDLPSVITNWRFHRIAFTADLRQMFRQILVNYDDAQFQRIVWRDSPNEPLREYYIKVVTFGTNCAPYLAIRSVQQLAYDQKDTYPMAAPVLLHSIYVDDVFAGADDVRSATELQCQLIDLFKEAAFELRKWVSNREEILQAVPEQQREIKLPLSLDPGNSVKTLGIYWQPIDDNFVFKFDFDINEQLNKAPTKRNILSIIARLFDPLGFIAPIILTAKILLRQLWTEHLDWDDTVSDKTKLNWNDYIQSLSGLREIKIPRWLGMTVNPTTFELHAFCDASEHAYAAVVYVRVSNNNINFNCSLLTSKTKIAPIKAHSIPRLELMGAVLMADLVNNAISHLQVPIKPVVFAWTDSTTVLHWLVGDMNRWEIFVANRISRIRDKLGEVQWQHISTHLNPADCASRGLTSSELITHPLWWTGPKFLQSSQEMWPRPTFAPNHFDDLAIRRIHIHQVVDPSILDMLHRFSSYNRLVRTTATIQSLAKKARHERFNNPISVNDLLTARNYWIRTVQKSEFSDDYCALLSNQPISKRSKILNLNPFLDNQQIMRVRGRLENSSLNYHEKFPIILPSKSHFTKLLIRDYHEVSKHGGPQIVLRLIRTTFWILNARNTVRFLIQKCVRCFRFRAKATEQRMGVLPSCRVQPSFVFSSTGVDFAGPINVRASKGRGRITYKGYMTIFVCMTVRAIHIELVSDMSTLTFLAALKRFIFRRTMCSHIYSDNGTTFVGATNQLKAFEKIWKAQIEKDIMPYLTNRLIQWHFIPPAAPHFGGIWEAGVKSVKYHLKRICGERSYTFEEWTTILTEIEGILNSRPLCPATADPDDLTAITPNHFLNGDIIRGIPEPTTNTKHIGLPAKWKQFSEMKQNFWHRWSTDYLSQLQSRPKWLEVTNDLKVNDLVIIKDGRLPPVNWLMGRVTKLTEGPDKLARVVTLRTKTTELVRPITKVCRLPIETCEGHVNDNK